MVRTSSHSRGGLAGFVGPLRLALLAATAAATIFVAAPAPTAAASPTSLADRVVAEARTHLGAPYVWGSTGPHTFDCSGLVYRVFADVGQLARIGGNRGGYGLYQYFAARHLASRTDPQVGDLVAWGYGAHVGIYIGHGLAISALVSGVQVHGVFAVTTPFTAYLHTHLDEVATASSSRTRDTAAPKRTAPTTSQRTAPTTTPTTSKRTAPAAPTGSAAHPGTRYAITALLVRAGPSTARARIGTVAARARLSVLASRRDAQERVWYEVELSGGRRGWVAGWLTKA